MSNGKNQSLDTIIEEISSLNIPELITNKRLPTIRNFIDQTINGDTVKLHLVIDANLTKDKSGIIVYVLTNARLIKIDIDTQEVKSASFFLDKIISIEHKLIDEDKAEVLISFENSSFGLRYPSEDKKITDFFQQVEQQRI